MRTTTCRSSTTYNRDLLPGLELGLYGSSFRFVVRSEDFDRTARRSDYNPDGLPERTILDAQVMEFRPVTYPQYGDATAGPAVALDTVPPRAGARPAAAVVAGWPQHPHSGEAERIQYSEDHPPDHPAQGFGEVVNLELVDSVGPVGHGAAARRPYRHSNVESRVEVRITLV